ncbi:MAG: Npt1/Npt2 family nucleotide transporter [Candidatus Aminicenantes bacterium]|jgi:AAA family ATP:ADP antiporter
MKELFRRIFDIREGEAPVATLMFFYGFLIIGSLSVLKPVRSSLFLVRFGSENLPFAYVLVAFFSGLFAVAYSRYSKKVRLNRLVQITLLTSSVTLVVFWIMLPYAYESTWFLYAFFIWVAIFGVITGTQFWLLANEIYNAREAKRLFGLIGAGAISGGIFGGYLTSYAAPRLSTANMIFFCIGFLALCQILVWSIWKKTKHIPHVQKSSWQEQRYRSLAQDNPLKSILNSRHLTYLAGIIGVGVVVANLADYQFLTIASRAKPEADNLTAFFGLWLSNLNILSLIIQMFFTGRIIKHLGVTASLLFLPCAIMIGAAAVLINPVLWSAILIKMGDGGFKHSINKASTELLAIPISPEIKNRVKSFIDVFIKNAAKGLGGVLLITLIVGFGLSVRHVSLIIIAMIGVWAYLIFRIKDEYVNSFRMAIEKRSINLEDQSLNLDDAAVFNNFIKVLEGKNERQILYVLNMLEDIKNKELVPFLKKLVEFPSDTVKASVLNMALKYEDLDLSSAAKNLVSSHDFSVRVEAIRYICKASSDAASTLQRFLEHENPRIQLAATTAAALEWRENKDFRQTINLVDLFQNMLGELQDKAADAKELTFVKINLARAIGLAKNSGLYPLLHDFVDDASIDVKLAAITSIGSASEKEFIPVLIAHLNTKHLRRHVREALISYGEDIIVILRKILENPEVDKGKKLAIPKVFAMIDSQKSVNSLMQNLAITDLTLRYEIIKALNKLRVKFPTLKFDPHIIQTKVLDEIELYKSTLRAWIEQKEMLLIVQRKSSENTISGQDKKARLLLLFALEEKLDKNLERIFRLLGMKYPPKDMVDAYLGLKSRTAKLKAIAIEFLDNILDARLKRILIPIVEAGRPELLSKSGTRRARKEITEELECIRSLLSSHDNWLKACTIYLSAALYYKECYDSIQELIHSDDPIVRETAQLYLRRLSTQPDLTTEGKV